MRSFFLFLGRVQLEVVSALLSEKYKLETVVKEPTVIYMEWAAQSSQPHHPYRVPPNPFWASIGLNTGNHSRLAPVYNTRAGFRWDT